MSLSNKELESVAQVAVSRVELDDCAVCGLPETASTGGDAQRARVEGGISGDRGEEREQMKPLPGGSPSEGGPDQAPHNVALGEPVRESV